jgi:hypothetical protein
VSSAHLDGRDSALGFESRLMLCRHGGDYGLGLSGS